MASYTGVSMSVVKYVNPTDTFLNLSSLTRSKSFAFDSTVAYLTGKWLNSGSITRNSISMSTISRNGVKWSSFIDIFYNRIWIIPPSIDLTGASTSFSTSVSIWNSYFVSKNLSSVTASNLPGITFAPTAPKTYKALEIATYTLSLTNAVPASVNGNYLFTFSDAEDPILKVSGILSVTYPFFHDWDKSLQERISFLTNIIEAKSGKEQRRRIRKYPRRDFQYSVLVADSPDYNRNALMRALYHNQQMFGISKTWLVPIHQDARYLGYNVSSGTSTINVNTQYHDYSTNGYVFLGNKYDDYEVVRIQSMTTSTITLQSPTTKNWTLGTTICPMRQCVIGQETSSGEVIVYEVENQNIVWSVLVQDNVEQRYTSYVPTYTYKGFPVYHKKADFNNNNTVDFFNPQRRLDNQTGIFKIDSRFPTAKVRTSLKVLAGSKKEISELIGFFYYQAGKLNPCWIPSYSEDIQLVQGGTDTSNTLIMKPIGYSTYIRSFPQRKDLMFIKTDGTVFFRRITGSSLNSDGTETISIDQAMGFTFTPSDFNLICFIRFCRLDSDVLELEYVTSDIASTTLNFVDVYEIP